MKKHAIIPIFIPHKGCPHNCIFCNQKKITARIKAVSGEDVENTIETWLSTLEHMDLETIEVAFYGGSFTAIPMSGGLITRADVAYAFCDQYDQVLPIWGLQKMEELEQFLACAKNPPIYDDEMRAFVAKEREELSGSFCRGCGYCMPCPQGIKITDCARMKCIFI